MSGGSTAPIYVDSSDFAGVQRAAHSVAGDIQAVTGKPPALVGSALSGAELILVGTIGHSRAIDQMIASGKLDVSAVQGRWETSLTAIVEHPLPGVRRALVIAGADKRGTIFGLYDLSEQIGVSPWAWWADVPVRHHDALYLLKGRYVQPEPRVRYRGIFLNDEAPSLTNWARRQFGGFNHLFYEHVFELLLRLKANLLWPAMWNSAFNEDDPLDPALADEFGIVMSTSHHEPMLRAQQEWKRHGTGSWDYTTNSAVLDQFWREGVRRNKDYESLVTLGMRGDGDLAMSAETNTALLERVVEDQRKILAEEVNPDVTKIPQVWALYKEVQGYYEKGMRVPNDVTLLWCDDNWGNLRRLPTEEERRRPGGAGIYYHFDYVGDPRSYKWLNTYSITKVQQQMHLADRYGANRIWIVNVGDLKPMEFPIEFFLSMARTPERWDANHLEEYTQLWAAREFGPDYAPEIARVVSEYTKYNGRRKPEDVEPGSFPDEAEADRMLGEYRSTVERADALSSKLDPKYRDAFFELVLFPAKASEVVWEINVAAARNQRDALEGRTATNFEADRVHKLFEEDAALTRQYNHELAGGRWDGMMDQTHLGYFFWNEPPLNIMPAVRRVEPLPGAAMGLHVTGQPSPLAVEDLPRFDPYLRTAHTVEIFNRGAEPFEMTASAADPWVKLDITSARVSAEVRLTVSINWERLPVGPHRSSVTIRQQGSDVKRILQVIADVPPLPTREDALAGFVETSMDNSGTAEGDPAEAHGFVSMEAAHFSSRRSDGAIHWAELPGFGATLSGMEVEPVEATSALNSAACLEYGMTLATSGEEVVQTTLAPTLSFQPGHNLRYRLGFDDGPTILVDAGSLSPEQDATGLWAKEVLDGVRRIETPLKVPSPGRHTLHLCAVDPGLVVEKLVVHHGALTPTYLGPPESFRAIPSGPTPPG